MTNASRNDHAWCAVGLIRDVARRTGNTKLGALVDEFEARLRQPRAMRDAYTTPPELAAHDAKPAATNHPTMGPTIRQDAYRAYRR